MCALHYRPGIEVVPGYELLTLLGRGGFGEVWKAKGPGGVTLAIKVIDKVDDKAGRKEFRALRLIKDINHPNLVTVSGFWLKDSDGRLIDPEAITDDPTTSPVRPAELIIAMDLGEMTLLEYLERCRKGLLETQKGGIPADELLEFMEASAKAIDYLNTRHDVQHRDIKPQNILIVGGSAKICDLGLASTVSSVRTSMGGAGSLAYMAPEVYTSKRPSRATDQYSLAIAYAELRTGRLPLSDCESYSVLDDAKRRGILDLSWLEEAERTVIAKATSVDPDERYPRCLDLVRALRRACEAGVQTVRPAETLQVLGDYILERRLHHRTGEEIFEATGPEGHRVLLVSRTPADSPDLADGKTLSLMRERSRYHPRLAELFEIVRLSETNRAVPPRLFEGPHPPAFTRLLLVSRHVPRSLAENLSGGGVAPGKLMGHMEQMAEVVDFLNAPQHEVGGRRVRLMHGNLRPVNFLIDNDQIYLTNFSAIHVLEGDETPFAAGQDVPEGPYTPPEYAAGKLTRWSDQYALAVAYLQLRTGRPASGLTGSTRSERTPDDSRRLDLSDLNPTEKDVLRRATAMEPSQRFANCTEMVQALYGAWNVMVARDKSRDSGSEPTRAAPLSSGSVGEAPTLVGPRPKFDSTSPTIDLDIVAQRAGTLVAPAQETRLSTDTDRGEPKAALATAQPDSAHQTLNSPHALNRPDTAQRGARTAKTILALAAIALVGAAAWHFWPDGGSAPLSPEKKWHLENVAPLLENRQFAEAVDKVQSAPADVAASKPAWLAAIEAQWQEHVADVRHSGPSEAVIARLNEFLTRFESNQPVTAWRAEDLEKLCERGERELEANDDKQAASTFQGVLTAIEKLATARGRPFDRDDENSRRATAGFTRAKERSGGLAALEQTISAAREHLEAKQFAGAWTELGKVVQDAEVAPLVLSSSGGPLAFEFVHLTLTTLSELPQPPIADVTRELGRLENGFFDDKKLTPPPGWLVSVSTAMGRLAVRPDWGTSPISAEAIARILRLLTKARTLATNDADRQRVEGLLPQLTELVHRKRLEELRLVRDSANDQKGFVALGELCSRLERDKLAHLLLVACRAEAEMMKGTSLGKIDVSSTPAPSTTSTDDDRRYIRHVRALCRRGAKGEAIEAELLLAWRGDNPAKPIDADVTWRKSPLRRQRVIEALFEAIKAKRDSDNGGPQMNLRRFSDDAESRFVFEATSYLLPLAETATDPDPKRIAELKVDRALAAAYGGAADGMGLTLTNALVADEDKTLRPIQVLLANIELNRQSLKSTKDAAKRSGLLRALVGAHRRLIEQARERSLSTVTIHRVGVAPIVNLLDETASSPIDPRDARLSKDIADLYAEQSWLVRLIPEVEQLFAATGPEQESLRAAKLAVKHQPGNCGYHISAGVLAYVICAEGDLNERQYLAARVGAVRELAKSPDEKCALLGLRGMDLAVESAVSAKTKAVEQLQQAAKAFAAADALRSQCSPEFLRSDDFQRMMLAWGAVYLRLGNFAPMAERASHLQSGVKLMQRVIQEHPNRLHPERAYGMLGNLQEDFGFKVGDLKGYEASQAAFEQQFTAAQDANRREKSRAKMNRGRAVLRWGNDALNEALGLRLAPAQLPVSLPPSETRTAEARKEALNRFNEAEGYLDEAIKLGADWKGIAAEAYLWKAQLDWHPLRANPERADESLAKAIALGETSWGWPDYVKSRVEHAAATAQRFASERNVEEAMKWLDRAEVSAKMLFKPTNEKFVLPPDRLAAAASSLIRVCVALNEPGRAIGIYEQALKLEPLRENAGSRFDLATGVLGTLATHPEVPQRRRFLADEIKMGHQAVEHAQTSLAETSAAQKTNFYRENERLCRMWHAWLAKAINPRNEAQINEAMTGILPHLRAVVRLQRDTAWIAHLRESGAWTQALEKTFEKWTQQLAECEEYVQKRDKPNAGQK